MFAFYFCNLFLLTNKVRMRTYHVIELHDHSILELLETTLNNSQQLSKSVQKAKARIIKCLIII